MADEPRFDPATLTGAANDTLTVRRVFGEAYERDGVTVVPVARVWGATGTGSGGGEGTGPLGPQHADDRPDGGGEMPRGSGHGGGGGYAVKVKAVGVYVLDDAGVHWRPAIDLNRVVLGGQVVAAVAALALAWALRRR